VQPMSDGLLDYFFDLDRIMFSIQSRLHRDHSN
jgi:hypothetical protein